MNNKITQAVGFAFSFGFAVLSLLAYFDVLTK